MSETKYYIATNNIPNAYKVYSKLEENTLHKSIKNYTFDMERDHN